MIKCRLEPSFHRCHLLPHPRLDPRLRFRHGAPDKPLHHALRLHRRQRVRVCNDCLLKRCHAERGGAPRGERRLGGVALMLETGGDLGAHDALQRVVRAPHAYCAPLRRRDAAIQESDLHHRFLLQGVDEHRGAVAQRTRRRGIFRRRRLDARGPLLHRCKRRRELRQLCCRVRRREALDVRAELAHVC